MSTIIAKYVGCRKGEVFVGNTPTGASHDNLEKAGVKYRVGELALDIYGKEIETWYMRPLFVMEESYDKYNRVMQAELEAIRRS